MNQYEQLRKATDAMRAYLVEMELSETKAGEFAIGRNAINELEILLAEMIKGQSATGQTLTSMAQAITDFTVTLRSVLAIVLQCAAVSKERGQEIAALESKLLELTNALN